MRTFNREKSQHPHRVSSDQAQSSATSAGPRGLSSFAHDFSGMAALAQPERLVQEALQAPGESLELPTRAFMGARFGHDFSRVRVHADTKAAESAEALGARAYTVGRHVVLGRHHPSSESFAGRRLLAHELAHVVQQSHGGPAPALDPSAPHEQEARAAATAVAMGRPSAQITRYTGVGLARDAKDLPLTDVSKEDPRNSPRYIDNVFEGVTYQLWNGAFIFDWQENGKPKKVGVPLSDVDQDDTHDFVPIFDVHKTKAEALRAADYLPDEPWWKRSNWRFYSFYTRPDGIIMPTTFSIDSTPKFHAMWPGLKRGIAGKVEDISEGLRTLANAINPIPGTTVDEQGNVHLSSNPLDWLALLHLRLSKIKELHTGRVGEGEGRIKAKFHTGYDVPYTVIGPHDKLSGTSVYVLKDAEGTVLYVGKGEALERLREHIKDPKKTQWFGEIAEVEVPATGLTNTQALALEQDLIGQLDPMHNVDRTPFKSVFGDTMAVGPNLPKPQKPLTFALHWGH